MTSGQKSLISALEAHIADTEAQLAEMRTALATVTRVFSNRWSAGVSRTTHVGRRPRRQPLAAGSLGDRILELAAQPVPLATLVDGAGARKGDVVKAVKQLVAEERLQQIGKSRATRYQVNA